MSKRTDENSIPDWLKGMQRRGRRKSDKGIQSEWCWQFSIFLWFCHQRLLLNCFFLLVFYLLPAVEGPKKQIFCIPPVVSFSSEKKETIFRVCLFDVKFDSILCIVLRGSQSQEIHFIRDWRRNESIGQTCWEEHDMQVFPEFHVTHTRTTCAGDTTVWLLFERVYKSGCRCHITWLKEQNTMERHERQKEEGWVEDNREEEQGAQKELNERTTSSTKTLWWEGIHSPCSFLHAICPPIFVCLKTKRDSLRNTLCVIYSVTHSYTHIFHLRFHHNYNCYHHHVWWLHFIDDRLTFSLDWYKGGQSMMPLQTYWSSLTPYEFKDPVVLFLFLLFRCVCSHLFLCNVCMRDGSLEGMQLHKKTQFIPCLVSRVSHFE